jgi:hypothetical protein
MAGFFSPDFITTAGDQTMTAEMVLVGEGIGWGFAQAFRDKAVRAAEEGKKRLERNDIEGAVSSFNDSIRHDPSFLAGRLMRAMALLRLSRWEEAVNDATAVIDEGQALAEAHAIRGIAYQGWSVERQDNNLQAWAQRDMATAKQLNPSYSEPEQAPAKGTFPAGGSSSAPAVDWGTVGGFAWSFLKGTAAVAGVIGMAALPHLARGVGDAFDRSRRGGFDCTNCGTFIHGYGSGRCPRCGARTY